MCELCNARKKHGVHGKSFCEKIKPKNLSRMLYLVEASRGHRGFSLVSYKSPELGSRTALGPGQDLSSLHQGSHHCAGCKASVFKLKPKHTNDQMCGMHITEFSCVSF